MKSVGVLFGEIRSSQLKDRNQVINLPFDVTYAAYIASYWKKRTSTWEPWAYHTNCQ